MTSRQALLLHPEFREPLSAFGRELPFQNIAEVLGCEPYSVAAFSDYGGDSADAPYEVFVTYIVHWNGLAPLVEALRECRLAMNGRTMDFKGRKDRVKSAHLSQWLGSFRKHPGLCIAICFDKRADAFPQSRIDRKAARSALGPFGISAAVAERMVRALSFLPVIGHLLRDRDRLVWVSDRDAVLEGAAGKELPTALEAMATQVIGRKLQAFGYCKPLIEDHELVLSLPDLVAGSLASALPLPLASGRMRPRDVECGTIVQTLAEFDDPHDVKAKGTRLLVILFRADPAKRLVHPRVIRLAPMG